MVLRFPEAGSTSLRVVQYMCAELEQARQLGLPFEDCSPLAPPTGMGFGARGLKPERTGSVPTAKVESLKRRLRMVSPRPLRAEVDSKKLGHVCRMRYGSI